MESNDWQTFVSKPRKKEYMTEWVIEQVRRHPYLDELLAWASGDGAKAFRAARCLEIVYDWDRPLFLKYKDRFLSDGSRVTHRGVRRIYTHLLYRMLEQGEYLPTRKEAEGWVQTLCAWSIEPGVKVSELVWYLSALNRLTGQVAWAGDMLRQIVAMNEVNRSPGMRALLKRVRKSFKIA